MKSIIKSIIFLVSVGLIMNACKKDQNQAVLSAKNAKNTLSASATAIVPDSTTKGATAITFKWDSVNYNVSTSITYALQFDLASDNFAKPFTVTVGTNVYSFSYADSAINALALKLGDSTSGSIQVRVLSYIQASTNFYDSVYSNSVSFTVTPYIAVVPLVLDYLWVPGAYQGWAPTTAPQIAGVDGVKYQGFVMITAANAPSLAFKLTTSNDWSHLNLGDNGSLATVGNITTDVLSGSGGNIFAPQAGYYFLQNDFSDSTLTMTLVNSWVASGTAVGSTPISLSYDSTSMMWSATGVSLSAGTLSFVGNAGTANLTFGQGAYGSNSIMQGATAGVTVATAGTYDIKLNLSTPYLYTDTLTKH